MAARMLTAFITWAKSQRQSTPHNLSLPDDAPFSEEWHATPPTVGDDLIFDEPLFGDEPFPDAPFSEEWHATPPLAGTTTPSPLMGQGRGEGAISLKILHAGSPPPAA